MTLDVDPLQAAATEDASCLVGFLVETLVLQDT